MSSSKLEVTEVTEIRSHKSGDMIGFCTVTINGALAIKSCRIFNNKGIIKVVPPSRPDKSSSTGWSPMVTFDRKYLEIQVNEKVTKELINNVKMSGIALQENKSINLSNEEN